MRVLVTGCTGFAESQLAEYLLQRNDVRDVGQRHQVPHSDCLEAADTVRENYGRFTKTMA